MQIVALGVVGVALDYGLEAAGATGEHVPGLQALRVLRLLRLFRCAASWRTHTRAYDTWRRHRGVAPTAQRLCLISLLTFPHRNAFTLMSDAAS